MAFNNSHALLFKYKKAVVITSRVHPGECNASWMMKGFLDYLTGSSADAKVICAIFSPILSCSPLHYFSYFISFRSRSAKQIDQIKGYLMRKRKKKTILMHLHIFENHSNTKISQVRYLDIIFHRFHDIFIRMLRW